MILKMYSLFDLKGSAYACPFFFNHDGQAIRAVMDAMASGDTTFARHPADFQLVRLGQWDDQHGGYEAQLEVLGPLTAFAPTRQTGPLFPQGD